MLPDPTAEKLIAALTAAGQSLATVESLTGGLIGATITGVPGASAVYRGGLITYSNEAKARLAGVSKQILDTHGAVSEQTATAMATGARVAVGSDWAIAVTGVAGPDAAEGHEPGLVWVALAAPGRHPVAKRLELSGTREQIRVVTVDAALSWLLALLADSGPSTTG
jgi:nicotinamide-nucleotide amidase